MVADVLSDEQVKRLLKDAEQRLRSQRKQPASSLESLQSSISTITPTKPVNSYIKTTRQGPRVDPIHAVSSHERKLANGIRKVTDPIMVKKKATEAKKVTAGENWFNLPRTNLTPELKRDLQLLRMRDVLDPKRHYKKDTNKVPEYSQVGTIIEGPTEYFSGRLINKQRKRTLVEEILEGEKSTQRFKAKYEEIQRKKMSGKKAHYNKMRETRTKRGFGKG